MGYPKVSLFTVIILMSICCMFRNASAGEKEITWIIIEQAPLFILRGDDQDQGTLDLVQKRIFKDMSSYRHRTVIANISRMTEELKKGGQVCISYDYYPTVSPECAVNSIPIGFGFPRVAIFSARRFAEMGKPASISFERLLKDARYRFGYSQGDRMGAELDRIFDRYRTQENTYERTTLHVTEGMLQMIAAGRIDYTVNYYSVYDYSARKMGLHDSIAFVPIQENGGSLVRGAISCSKTEWGLRTIKEINKTLLRIRSEPDYVDLWAKYHSPPGKEAEYRKLFKEIVLSVVE